jgi:pimeloyl-ACP methyl ester carboxylesterase
VKKPVLSMFLEVGEQVFINQENALINRSESMSILPTIKCPTMIVHAREDKNFSLEMHQELQVKIPRAKLAIVDDSGHMAPMERPQAITTLMRYWLTYF